MSVKFGFGTYRVVDQNLEHVQALRFALESGVRIIDTSSNYMDGASERAIAKVLSQCDDTQDIEIISKFGYIQGTLLDQLKADNPFRDVVPYSEHCYHCIDAAFMREQLSQSLQRLQRDTLTCYLLHNPEYYMYDALHRNVAVATVRETMLERIYKVFVALEHEVQQGRIQSYGISSNSFAKACSEADFLPYEDLMVLADNAAREAGSGRHHFTTVELPINLLEQEGLRCAAWAKEQGLRVIANRVLNAQKDNHMFRLADYERPREYDYYLNNILELCAHESLQPVYNIIEQLDGNRHQFPWIGAYDAFVFTHVIPHLHRNIAALDDDDQTVLIEEINLFLEQLKKMVAYECSQKTRTALKEILDSCESSLQQCAVNFLITSKKVDVILVGMRKPSYVADITAINL
ncbi:MAG: aldo/keto reductase [Sulfurimonas sp.]|nr:MAG: aldo/keto reductase [Sulfurimonas sp.]